MLQDIKKEISKPSNKLKQKEIKEILKDCDSVLEFESNQLSSRIHYFISRNESITKSSLIQHSVPIVLNEEIKEAKAMGFADKITPDFVFHKEKAIGDMKTYQFDQKDQSYKLAITGYALAYEKQHNEDIDCGFILYCLPHKNRFTPLFELEVFPISDVLRKNFIEKRNRLAQMVYKKIKPNLATKCPESCPYLSKCAPGKSRIDKNK
ncbi:hypothetical protein NADRNF5_1375 [Nitrosopumilus adriaticus]|uniref:DUF83 domain-containing protein n=2 Tax=Nitrosopumilus adriaticus TaxID=1580092 RepID=A0A0D5C2X0_9ARCH|nr:hypothetical protein NADRNF5_1375 [Nitrosopumilus adriaticus]